MTFTTDCTLAVSVSVLAALISLTHKPPLSPHTVIRAANLPPMDANGLADPYVKLRIMPDSSKSAKQRSERQEKTLNPEWDETFF